MSPIPHPGARRALALAAICGTALSFMACTTVGTGTGSTTPGNKPVAFSWTSKDGGTSGTMTASVGEGTLYTGPFVQLTSTLRAESFEPMWYGWRRGWSDWGGWGGYPGVEFATQYSGKVVANLQAPDGRRLRCRFTLNAPTSGMAGGGQGECQNGAGRSVDAVFSPS